MTESLQNAVQRVPSGSWAVGVSGGADSVALLRLLRARTDLSLHVAHLNHEARGAESDADEEFVQALSSGFGVPFSSARLTDVLANESTIPSNPSALYRAARLRFFSRVVDEHRLAGVILAHHAGDQAETVFLRLLRGSGYAGLGGMSTKGVVEKLHLLRPLLDVGPDEVRSYLRDLDQTWREDSSNSSRDYLRNRVRVILDANRALRASLLELGAECRRLREWVGRSVGEPAEKLSCIELLGPRILADEIARRWLVSRGARAELVGPGVIDRIVAMANDAGTASQQTFPGSILVRRRRGVLFTDSVGSTPVVRQPSASTTPPELSA